MEIKSSSSSANTSRPKSSSSSKSSSTSKSSAPTKSNSSSKSSSGKSTTRPKDASSISGEAKKPQAPSNTPNFKDNFKTLPWKSTDPKPELKTQPWKSTDPQPKIETQPYKLSPQEVEKWFPKGSDPNGKQSNNLTLPNQQGQIRDALWRSTDPPPQAKTLPHNLNESPGQLRFASGQ